MTVCENCCEVYADEDEHPDHQGLCGRCAGDVDASMGRAIVEARGPRGWYHDGSAEEDAGRRAREARK